VQRVMELSGIYQHVGRRCALEDVNLELEQGEWLLLIGPNGAGKSLLARLILGLDTPSAGTVRVLGQPLSDLGASAMRRWRGEVGAVLQGGSLVQGLTVLENLLLPLRAARANRGEMARAARLAVTQLQLDGLEAELPRALSLGQRRRVELARALIHKPRLLVWDGLTDGLDAAGVRETLDLLHQQHANRGLALIATDNRPEALAFSGARIGVLDRGRLVFSGAREDLEQAARHRLELRYVLEGHP
jgi:D-methionine transport system ATP-binding protein